MRGVSVVQHVTIDYRRTIVASRDAIVHQARTFSNIPPPILHIFEKLFFFFFEVFHLPLRPGIKLFDPFVYFELEGLARNGPDVLLVDGSVHCKGCM